MNRHPWRTRAGLLALIDAVAGVFVALGFGTDTVDPWTAGAVAFVAFVATLGLVTNGENTTTPVDDPLGRDGLPLVGWSDAEAARGDDHAG